MRMALRILRIKHGLSQEEMGKRLGFTRNHYQRIEVGEANVSLKFIVALSEAFGMSLEEAKELTKRDGE